MWRTTSKIGRILASVIVLFIASILGAILCDALFLGSARVSKMEMLAGKVGSSVGILIAAILLQRYLLRSFGMALICLVATEAVAFLIIIHFTGLFDISFAAGWLYSLTWNVVVAFLCGAVIGQFWNRWAANKG